jgi:hypothetical protein
MSSKIDSTETIKDKEKLFEAWLNGEPLDDKLSTDEAWSARLHAANFVQQQSDTRNDIDVPDWDRAEAFISDKQSWWEWTKLPAVSMAFSIFAVFLVLFNVQVINEPDGMIVSFGKSKSTIDQANINTLVDLKLREFAAEQQIVLANYATDISHQQQKSNMQLASYLLGTSRQERKEDITEFIRYINDQRKDEQIDQSIKFQQIEHELHRQQNLIHTNVYGKNVGENNIFTPANYTPEEK